ncbi:MAG: hypothetical protein HRT87_07090 [Legionellales bacterium]|nr:hypothetical protein [Legionellales bacterium]
MKRAEARRRILKELNNKVQWRTSSVQAILDEYTKVIKIDENAVKIISNDVIIATAAEICETTIDKILGGDRKRHVVLARSLCYNALRSKGYTFSAIGKIFSRDHSGIVYNIKVLKIDIKNNFKPVVEKYSAFQRALLKEEEL